MTVEALGEGRPTPTRRHHLFHSYLRMRRRLSRRTPTRIAAGPHQVSPWFLPWNIGQLLNVEFVTPAEANGAELAMWFEVAIDPPVRRTASDYFGDLPALNAGCADTSKRRVMRVFEEVFGYGYAVDPLTHSGRMVAKSDANGKSYGKLLTGPIEAEEVEPDLVYQRLIDFQSGNVVRDLRVCVVGGEIPYFTIKVRPVEKRFEPPTSHVDGPPSALPSDDRERVLEFCRRFGLDVGELDVARDQDGKLYVLDVNPTPFSPPLPLTRRMAYRNVRRAADAFERQFLASGGN